MGIPDRLSCLLRNLYTGQEATVRTGHGITNWFQIEKGICQSSIFSAFLTNMQSTSWKMLGWMKHKLETRFLREISIISDMQPHTSTENWIKDLLNMAPPHPSEQDPISPSVSFSHQEASISLLPFSITGQKDWKPQPQKTNQSDHMDHSFV